MDTKLQVKIVKCPECPDKDKCPMANTAFTKDGCKVQNFV